MQNFKEIDLDEIIKQIILSYPNIITDLNDVEIYFEVNEKLNENSFIIECNGSSEVDLIKTEDITSCNLQNVYIANYTVYFSLNNLTPYDRKNLNKFKINFERWIRSFNTKLDELNEINKNIKIEKISCANAQIFTRTNQLSLYQVQINITIKEIL